MTKNFNDLYKEIVKEMVIPGQNQTQQPQQPAQSQSQQPQQPAQTQSQQQGTQPNSNRLQAITTALTQLQDPTHLDAVEKLLASLNAQKPNAQQASTPKPNAA